MIHRLVPNQEHRIAICQQPDLHVIGAYNINLRLKLWPEQQNSLPTESLPLEKSATINQNLEKLVLGYPRRCDRTDLPLL